MPITIGSGGYRVTVAPDFGATILRADWDDATGRVVPLLEPLYDPQAGMKSGCFVMAPFANRIVGGKFHYKGRDYRFPMNRPDEGTACHGYARDAAWTVQRHDPDFLICSYRYDDDTFPWRFDIQQDILVNAAGISVRLHLTHRGDDPMPYGFGLHPWFPRSDTSVLQVPAQGAYPLDTTGLPVSGMQSQPQFRAPTAQPLGAVSPFDRCLVGWSPRQAVLRNPDQQTEITMTATGALRHVHVFVPATRDVVCVEPVSHVPDAIHRPELGDDAMMQHLSSGESMTGAMTISARLMPPSNGHGHVR